MIACAESLGNNSGWNARATSDECGLERQGRPSYRGSMEAPAEAPSGRARRNSLQAELNRECRHVPEEDFKILSGMSGLWDRPQVRFFSHAFFLLVTHDGVPRLQGLTERAESGLSLGGRFGSQLFFPGYTVCHT